MYLMTTKCTCFSCLLLLFFSFGQVLRVSVEVWQCTHFTAEHQVGSSCSQFWRHAKHHQSAWRIYRRKQSVWNRSFVWRKWLLLLKKKIKKYILLNFHTCMTIAPFSIISPHKRNKLWKYHELSVFCLPCNPSYSTVAFWLWFLYGLRFVKW